MQTRQELGRAVEREAARYLGQQGLVLLTQNYHCRFGEIDLIMRDGSDIVFVEVRYRRLSNFGNGAESVTFSKQQKIIKTAQYFLLQSGYKNACRFDVIAAFSNWDRLEFEWIKNAFQLSY